jgi:outer membrane immunogenic protein
MSRSRWFSAVGWSVWCMFGLMLAAPIALADGMPRRAAQAGEQPFSWTGFYVGGHAGLATGNTTDDPNLPGPANLFSTDFTVNGALYGGQAGYNWQSGLLVFGVEGSLSQSTIQGNTTCVLVLECKRDVDWLATATGRVGYAMGRTLVYGMGGAAWADVSTKVGVVGIPLLSGSDTHTGWIAGFGFEYALSNHISTRIEYAHIDLGSSSQTLSGVGILAGVGPVVRDSVDLKMDTIRLGVNIKLY